MRSIKAWWHRINHCQFCDRDADAKWQSSLFVGTPQATTTETLSTKLADAQKIHGYRLKSFDADRPVCAECLTSRLQFRCAVTHELFRAELNVVDKLTPKIRANLAPLGKFHGIQYYLSPEGWEKVNMEYTRVMRAISSGIKRSRNSSIPRNIVTNVVCDLVTRNRWDTSDEAALELDWLTAQVGGNGYINFFWQPHDESWEERVVAGHGPQGNPYYRTERHRKITYSATCRAVVVAPDDGRAKAKKPEPRETPLTREGCLKLLGLKPGYTPLELSAAYKREMALNHPDKVAHLSADIRALAEAKSKELNAAYDLLKS